MGTLSWFCFSVNFFLFFFFNSSPFDWVCKFCGGGWWGHQKLYNSRVVLVVMASSLLMDCRLHVVYVQLISVRLLVKIENMSSRGV